jgi:hypothetical protein
MRTDTFVGICGGVIAPCRKTEITEPFSIQAPNDDHHIQLAESHEKEKGTKTQRGILSCRHALLGLFRDMIQGMIGRRAPIGNPQNKTLYLPIGASEFKRINK